eukprot:2690563-Amphidinium_carterae.2
MRSNTFVLTLAIIFQLTVHLSDISTASLNARLKSTIHIKPPPKIYNKRITTMAWFGYYPKTSTYSARCRKAGNNMSLTSSKRCPTQCLFYNTATSTLFMLQL